MLHHHIHGVPQLFQDGTVIPTDSNLLHNNTTTWFALTFFLTHFLTPTYSEFGFESINVTWSVTGTGEKQR